MIVKFPDKRYAGTMRDELISFVDLAPTILTLAGFETPNHLQGQNFLGANRYTPRDYIYATRDRLDEFHDKSRAVRDGRYKLIRNYISDRPLFESLDYRENLASMQDMRRLLKEDKLPPHIKTYFTGPRPEYELFDVENDPNEINNLAGQAEFKDIQSRLTSQLETWINSHSDTGQIPEAQMVASMWPNNKQPKTLPAKASLLKNKDGSYQLSLLPQTEGASIEYRLSNQSGWNLYTKPVLVSADQPIETRSIRYGYKQSDVIRTSAK